MEDQSESGMFHVKHPAFFAGAEAKEAVWVACGGGGGVGISPCGRGVGSASNGAEGPVWAVPSKRHAESSCPTGATGVATSNAGGGAVGAA